MRKLTLLMLFVAGLLFTTTTFAQKKERVRTSPVAIFNYKPKPAPTLEQQRERLIIASAVRPVMKGDKLALPERRKDIDPIYYSYVEQLIAIINPLIPELSDACKDFLIANITGVTSIEDLILISYFRVEDRSYVLDLKIEDALKIGFTKEYYDRSVKMMEDVNREIKNAENLIMNVDTDKPFFILCPTFIVQLKIDHPELFSKFDKQFQELNNNIKFK